MQKLVNHIISYLDYLQENCRLSITLHDFQRITSPHLVQFLPYRVHSNPYCIYLKAHTEIWDACIGNQKKLLLRLADGPFYGACHCGVEEYVYPLKQYTPREEVIGFISVSGYRGQTAADSGKIKHICEKYDLNYQDLLEIYRTHLSPDIPGQSLLDTLLYPLAFLLESLYQKECLLYGETPSQASNRDIILNRILLYIERNFHRQICMEDICSIFHCSRSYVGHMFKSATGYPLREYINLMRIEESKNLLRNTSLSITDIALRTGFSNSNYFTSVFHRQTGKTPTEYRRIQPVTDRHSSAFG